MAAATTAGEFERDFLINCAGLHCDRVAELAGEARDVRIVPFRGEYYKIRPERQHLVRHLIYPVPDPKFPFLGVHFTRLIHGGIEAGPNAVLAFAREGYRKTDFNVARSVRRPHLSRASGGFCGAIRRCAGTSCGDPSAASSFANRCSGWCRRSSRTTWLPAAPACARRRSRRRANWCRISVVARPNALHVLNAPSPAATASLAIGDEIVEMIAAG